MVWSIISITLLSAALGLGLGWAARRFRVESDPVVDQINQILPQTQCGQCSYPGCRPYAEAIVAGEAAINLCPPGGDETVLRLAELLGTDPLPLAAANTHTAGVAMIDEALCIGCTHCRNACPVDAIVMTSNFEFATNDHVDLVYTKTRLIDNGDRWEAQIARNLESVFKHR